VLLCAGLGEVTENPTLKAKRDSFRVGGQPPGTLFEGWRTAANKTLSQLDMIQLTSPNAGRDGMPNTSRKFETPRTRQFRATGLNKEDDRTIGHIEEFGCSVVQVKKTEYGLGWSYTVGVYDTGGNPEIITVGLPEKTALFALNEATKRLRSGVDLTQGRHRDIVGDVECEFRPVDPKWVKHLMGRAIWFYGGTDFPVLQAIYPDLENRFPEEVGFDNTFERPLMQSGAQMRKVEDDFWASADSDSKCNKSIFSFFLR